MKWKQKLYKTQENYNTMRKCICLKSLCKENVSQGLKHVDWEDLLLGMVEGQEDMEIYQGKQDTDGCQEVWLP